MVANQKLQNALEEIRQMSKIDKESHVYLAY